MPAFHKYLRVTPFDVSTEEGRSAERYRRALLSSLASATAKVANLIVLLVSVPLTLAYLGEARFGLWMLIASLPTVFALLDFGVGNAVVNVAAGSTAVGQSGRRWERATSGLFLLTVVGALVAVAGVLSTHFLSWGSLIKDAHLLNDDEIRDSAAVFFLLLGLSFPLSLIQRLYYATQRGYVASIVSTCASIASLLALPLLARHEASVSILLLSTYGFQVFANVLLISGLLKREMLSPPKSFLTFSQDCKSLLHAGWFFFVLQAGYTIGWGTDTVLVSAILGSADVALLAIVTRVFQLVLMPLALANQPLWPAYAEAASRKDTAWIRKTLKYSLSATLGLSGLLSLLLFVAWDWILSVWLDRAIAVRSEIVLLFAAWTTIQCVANAFSMFLNGVNLLRMQMTVVCLFALVVIPLKVLGLREYGLEALPVSMIAAFLTLVFLPYATVYRSEWGSYVQGPKL